ncbi:MAG: FMN-binding protein [Oscillospiraceae bacterium]
MDEESKAPLNEKDEAVIGAKQDAAAPEAAKADGEQKPKAESKLPPKPPKSKEQLAWEAARKKKFHDKVRQPILWPLVTLTAICLVASLLLGLTNALTAPVIAQNATAEADRLRQTLLPGADSFTQMELVEEAPGVTALYAADNGAGWVVDSYGKGYGGEVPAMVAFDASGVITGVIFPQNNETPGLGKKLETDEKFREQFAGRAAETIAMDSVDKIANATISTGAAVSAINAAIDVYNSEILGQATGAMTPEEVREFLLPGAVLTAVQLDGHEGVQDEAFVDEATGSVIVYGEAKGVHSTVVAAVAIDTDGVILGLWLDTSGETEGLGAPVQSNRSFVQAFVGQSDTDGVQAVAGATLTSEAAKAAVESALAAASGVADAPKAESEVR